MEAQWEIKILFVINPGSGSHSKVNWETTITDFFATTNAVTELFILDDSYNSKALGDIINTFKPQKVVAVGGDGTVAMVAKLVLGTDVALGILAAGSANGMAKELGLPVPVQEQLSLILEGTVRNADVIRINEDDICLHLSDIGLNARLIKHFEEGKFRGKFGYASKVIKTLWTKSSIDVKMKTGEKEASHKAFMVVLANARMYGTGAVINPMGDLYDGHFEVVIVKRIAVLEIFKMLFFPRPFNPKKIRVYPVTSVCITTTRPAHFQIDGEYKGKVNKVDASILKGKLRIIVPPPMV